MGWLLYWRISSAAAYFSCVQSFSEIILWCISLVTNWFLLLLLLPLLLSFRWIVEMLMQKLRRPRSIFSNVLCWLDQQSLFYFISFFLCLLSLLPCQCSAIILISSLTCDEDSINRSIFHSLNFFMFYYGHINVLENDCGNFCHQINARLYRAFCF